MVHDLTTQEGRDRYVNAMSKLPINETEKSNNLIASFLGWKKQKDPTERFFGDWFDNNRIRRTRGTKEILIFHSSWDWLIPVIKHIREIVNVKLTIHDFECFRELGLTISPYDYTIEQVYDGVIKFIKWYNQEIQDKY